MLMLATWRRKTKQKAKNDEIRDVIRDVNELRTEMREIKDLLIGLSKWQIE